MENNTQKSNEEMQDNLQDNLQENSQTNSQTNPHKKKKSFFNSNLFRLFVALFVLCACAGLGAGIAILEDKSDPTNYVAGYFGKFLIQDYDAMYEYVDLEGVYAPKDAFAGFMRTLREEHNIGEYEFGEPEKKGDRYLMQIFYLDGETGEQKTFDVYLIKHRENWKQIVADWKISIDEYLVKDYMIEVPEGMVLELDGNLVDESFLSTGTATGDIVDIGEGETIEIIANDDEENGTTHTIRIHKMIKGAYHARVLTDYTQISKELTVVFNEQQEVMDAAEIKVRDEYISLIEAKAPPMIQEFYSVVRNKKSSSKELLEYFVSDENVIKSLKKVAKKNQKVIYWEDIYNIDEYSLNECNFSDLQYTASYAGDNKIKAVYTFTYDYFLSTSAELYSSYIETYSGVCSSTMEITYSVVDGDIKVSDIVIKNDNRKENE